MNSIEQLETFIIHSANLIQGANARIKNTGQIVELKKVSEHGISLVSFRTGGEYFMPNKSLEPIEFVTVAH